MTDWVSAGTINAVGKTTPPILANQTLGGFTAVPGAHAAVSSNHRLPIRGNQRSFLRLYIGSLAVVAVLALLLGWVARSPSLPDNDQPPARTDKPPEDHIRSDSEDSSLPPAGGNHRAEAPTEDEHSAPRETRGARHDQASRDLPGSQSDSVVEVRSLPTEFPSQSVASGNEPTDQSQHALATPAEQDPSEPADPVATVPGEAKPLILFQDLNIQRQPTLSVLGTVMRQDIHYCILSELHIGEADEAGFRHVQQVVKGTRLVKADALSQAIFAESLKRLVGWQFSYKLNSRNEVVEIRGPDDGKDVVPVEPSGAKGFLVTSVMDEDGWKELAELSFFAPDSKGMQNQSWTRQMTHNYEPLGSWFGETTFIPRGHEQGLMRFDYTHKLTYNPPKKGVAIGGDLDFAIRNADFTAVAAGGAIYFDARLKRVRAAQEHFHLRGTLAADTLGQVLNIPVEEKQSITVRIEDVSPWEN